MFKRKKISSVFIEVYNLQLRVKLVSVRHIYFA